jgi:hypothetical protein
MLFNDLFESDREPYQQAIDRLEMAHINNLNAKMDAIIGRVNREKLTDEHKAALKKEYIKIKAERDSIYGIKDGTPEFTVECDAEGNASVIDRIGQAIAQFTAKKYGSTAFDAATAYAGSTFKKANLDDIAGWENAAARKTGPVRLRPVVKQKQNTEVVVSEWRNTAPGADEEQRKLKKVGIVRQKTHRMSEESSEQELDEGWSDAIVSQRTGQPRTPYSVYINGKKWKDFENDDHAENVANKLRAKFKADGRDPSVITVAPTDYDKGIEEGIGDTVRKATKYAMGGMRVNNAIRKHERRHDAAMKANDITTAKKEIRHVNRLDNKYNPVDDPMEEGSMADAEHHASGAKFGGYYKGTQVGAPRPGQGFGAESVQHEGAKVDRMVKHIAKSERAAGKSAKDAEAIAWATANKRGYLDNANKKDEGMNFMEWAVAQGSRFANFAVNPEVYSQARTAYLHEDIYGGIPKIAKVPTGAMYSNAKLPTLKTNLRKAKEQKARTAKALNKSLAEESAAEAELKPGQYYVWTVHFDDGTESQVKVTSDQFDPKAYYAKKNKVVIKTDYDWTIHG